MWDVPSIRKKKISVSARARSVRKFRAPTKEREQRVLTGREVRVPREGAVREAEVALGSPVVHDAEKSLMLERGMR